MSPTERDVVIVGGGVMGAATAWALARAGRDVLLLERFEIGHRRGSSHGRSRIFRLSYGEPPYVRMAQEALGLWRELEAETGDEILRTTGGLDIGAEAEDHARTLEESGVAFELLEPAAAAMRFRVIALPAYAPVLFQPDAGIVLADRAVAAFVGQAKARGAEVRERARVTGLAIGEDRVEIRTDAETFRARVAVSAAGAWARGLLAGADIDLPVRHTRETVAYFRMEEPIPSVVEWTSPAMYALVDPGKGIKAAEHHAGMETDPEREEGPDPASVARVQRWVRERFPGVDDTEPEAETCLYTNTEDESFILDRRGPVVIGSPCSGHGFKFAPVIGRRLAELATEP